MWCHWKQYYTMTSLTHLFRGLFETPIWVVAQLSVGLFLWPVFSLYWSRDITRSVDRMSSESLWFATRQLSQSNWFVPRMCWGYSEDNFSEDGRWSVVQQNLYGEIIINHSTAGLMEVLCHNKLRDDKHGLSRPISEYVVNWSYRHKSRQLILLPKYYD